MPVEVDFDYCYETDGSLEEGDRRVREVAGKYGLEAGRPVYPGPGGGWPMYTVRGEWDILYAFLMELYACQDENDIDAYVNPVMEGAR